MKSQTKISTCSYCLARVIISITPGSRHDLICNSCGARLEHTEFLEPPTAPEQPVVAPPQTPLQKTQETQRAAPTAKPLFSLPRKAKSEKSDRKSYSKSKKKEREKKNKEKKKKKRGLGYWIREAIDEIEDIFD